MRRTVEIMTYLAIGTFVAGTYLHPIQLKGQFTKTAFGFLSSYSQQHSLKLMQFLLKFQFIKNNGSMDLKGSILSAGFDTDGQYLTGLQLLGLSGVQIGPATLLPSQTENGLGINYVLANINTYYNEKNLNQQKNQEHKQKTQKKTREFKIGVFIEPDSQVLEFTPYLIPDNVTKCVNSLLETTPNLYYSEKEKEDYQKYKQTIKKQIKQKQNVDFISINCQKIAQSLGSEVKEESEKMLSKLMENLKIYSADKKIDLYAKTQKGNKRTQIQGLTKQRLGQEYKFVSWKDIIAQIIKQ